MPAGAAGAAGGTNTGRACLQASAVIGDVAKIARQSERFSDARLGQIRTCTDGQCSVRLADANPQTQTSEPVVMCRSGCGRSLHVRSCAHISNGHGLVGRFVCHILSISTPPECAWHQSSPCANKDVGVDGAVQGEPLGVAVDSGTRSLAVGLPPRALSPIVTALGCENTRDRAPPPCHACRSAPTHCRLPPTGKSFSTHG